jgi:transcriptional regulator with GAF, ATPase, and Fis domain/CHASE2 domain-containing sensor protein
MTIKTIKILTVIVAALAVLFFQGAGKFINRNVEGLFCVVGGEDIPDTNIIILHISESDIESIGPWPIKRSYYALLVNSLTKYDVKAIGLEVFLSAKFVTQTIYDNLLTKEIEKSGRVVLSSVAGNIQENNGEYVTDSLSYPSPKLLNEEFKTGHLNFLDDNGIEIPLKITSYNTSEKAFSFVLSGAEETNYGRTIKINFLSSWERFKKFSLLEYFEMVQNENPELNNLKDKIVIIGISDPQISSTIKTNFDDLMPGAALHAFVLDNILNNRLINESLVSATSVFFPLLLIFLLILTRKLELTKSILLYLVTVFTLLLAAFLLFRFSYIQLNYTTFLFPIMLLVLIDTGYYLFEKQRLLTGAIDEKEILKALLSKKEDELAGLQKELNLSADTGSFQLVEKIKLLKADIEKLKEREEDKTEAEIITGEPKEFYGIVYKSKAISGIIDLIKRTAPEEANVLVLGESGTGKELVAKAIHALSRRSNNNFVAVNCGALSDTLLESELFGHVKGAFTGAASDKIGRFEAANNGTIFLDEIAETSENFQVKLLRVIQTGDFEKVGSSKTEHTDVRIIAATNKDLEKAVKEKKFREDLYYRLNVIKMELPPLRERKEEIEILVDYFLNKESSGLKISRGALKVLNDYEWKGNIRELEAVIKRAYIFAKSSERNLIQLSDLPAEIVKGSSYNFEDLVMESLRNKEFSHASITETAKELGNVSRTLVSENFRGVALKVFIENNYEVDSIVRKISGTEEAEVNERVKSKIVTILRNISDDVKNYPGKDFEFVKSKLISKYKNLPQRFHLYLDEVIRHHIK